MIKIYKFLLKRELHYIIDWLKQEEKYLSDKEINSQITGNFELITLTKGRYYHMIQGLKTLAFGKYLIQWTL